ncbi:MAG TPA: class I SAM-dependent rRNA methyltransferase [Ruminiclostridium sp.]|nr:class I SAM-dependent rRNA methyltransferase [Ruminiclostridium sp.]
MADNACVFLKRGEEKDIFAGHLWIYDNEVERIEREITPGQIVDVKACNGAFLGRGYINPKSKILVRLLTRSHDEINHNFIKSRLESAFIYRDKLGLNTNERSAFRAVFGEADFLPALVVDKFADCLVIQTLALGIEMFKADIVQILRDYYNPRCIYERNDVPLREKEGLEQKKGVLYGEEPGIVEIEENGVRLLVDIVNGQKTGYFLDQKENRAAIQPYCKEASVLDCFCHTGGFALHAAKFGAKEVEAVDISETALQVVSKNAALNGFNSITTKKANVFDLLNEYQMQGRMFDTVILDPPAFCKTKSALKGAYRGYKEINLRGMKLVRSGGFLVTCSCSHYMTPDLFMKMLQDAALDSRRSARICEIRYQAKDHPVSINADESLYLKYVALQII